MIPNALINPKLEISLRNILKANYELASDGQFVTVKILDRLLDQESLMLLFEAMHVYGYREESLAYANLRFIEEFPHGESFTFTPIVERI